MTVPWSEAEIAYRTYSKLFGTSQSLERLAERGGFDIWEYAELRFGLNPLRLGVRAGLRRSVIDAARVFNEDPPEPCVPSSSTGD